MILQQLLDYVQLDDRDRANLVALHARLSPHFPAIAVKFYDAVWRNPAAAAVLSGPEQVERLRVTLIDWMSTGLLGPYDRAFNEKRARIGKRHVQIGLAQQFMFTAMNVVRGAYLDHVRQLYSADEALDVIGSVDKLFDIELALMLRHYQLDSEDKLIAREHTLVADRVRSLQTLTTGLAHEVRNPLNAAKLQLELLERRLRRSTDDEKLVAPAELASQEIARLGELLDDFLSFARVSELNLGDHDVVAIARHVIELERPLAERSHTELVLASSGDAVMARVDPMKLHQIVQNLVRNAVEATPQGHVEVGVTAENGHVHVRVMDDGPGIPEHVRHRIYEPFFSTKEGGTGMGMSIVHNYVTMHGGKIDLATGPRGTSVDVTIPRGASS